MQSTAEPDKRVVSRSKYFLTKTFAFSLSGILALCAMCVVLLLSSLPYAAYLDAQYRAKDEGPSLLNIPCLAVAGYLCLFTVPILIIVGFCFRSVSRKSWETVRTMQPINYADTANLPAPTSLVRASQEPAQEQEGILLRAVAEGQEKHEEQLLRASAGRHE